ncbi:uncharacterized protein LOC129767052 [Toxorhynchites rutilus septentrionalis]|uniref:uncharacterized protein LOC129767052 n=1 Tax=Toxorhynchites rutilus septentrionalis TaxID=329112 RepID=UPI00247A80D3|nr:uncharacterized protein LOC129767052 [Toxorhynchites rutilus septentrionalis]
MSPIQFQYQRLWFKGPFWLCQEKSLWPSNKPRETIDSSLLEEKSIIALPTVIEQPNEIFSLRSSLFELTRVVALINRFRHNSLTHAEHEHAMIILIRLSQRESFAAEISALRKGHQISTSSSIATLNPILIDDVLRVGGRLMNAAISSDRKHPIILSHRHPLTKLIMVQYHRKLFHAGLQLLVSTIREKYWPTRIRRLTNTVLHECVSCFRTRPKVLDQLMADLPSERVSPAPPFLKVGVDYCGPLPVVYPGRRAVPRKSFIAIFVCLMMKAVHLELAGDLTSEAFLAAFKRFIARRGKPAVVMCDNALNFVGARRELDVLRQLFLNQQFQESAVREAAQDGIDFRFIPPRSPSFGRLWEAAVKSIKTHFKRSIGVRVVQHDEMQTVVVPC